MPSPPMLAMRGPNIIAAVKIPRPLGPSALARMMPLPVVAIRINRLVRIVNWSPAAGD